MMRVLFICHANICRSFMAQEFLKQLLPGVEVFSRGLYADSSYLVPKKVLQVLQQHRIVFNGHTSAQLTQQDLAQADLIFCMEQAHADFLLDRYAQYTDKIWLLTDYAFDKPYDLQDPIGLEGRSFEKQAQRLHEACAAAAQRITHEFLTERREL